MGFILFITVLKGWWVIFLWKKQINDCVDLPMKPFLFVCFHFNQEKERNSKKVWTFDDSHVPASLLFCVRRHRHTPQPPPLCSQWSQARRSTAKWCHWTLFHHPQLLKVVSNWRWGWMWTSARTHCHCKENPWRPYSQLENAVEKRDIRYLIDWVTLAVYIIVI